MNPTSNGINVAKVQLIILIGLSLMIRESLFAQYENYTWFSGRSRLQFDLRTKEPKISSNPNRFSSEGGAMLNDPLTGTPLFYTDGNTVYNRLNQVMANGRDLGGSETNAQGCAIAAVPGECNQYYLFVNGLDDPHGLRVSKIDLNANGGLGTVLSNYKNRFLRKDVFEAMQVIPKPFSNESWLIVPVDPKTGVTHVVFAITASGIREDSSFKGPNFTQHYTLTYHPESHKLAGSLPKENTVYSLNFDPSSGKLSDFHIIANNLYRAYDTEWSTDGSKLYFSSWKDPQLWQYDYNSSQLTKLYEGTGDGGALKLGPDGNIYYIQSLQTTSIGRIHSPNEPGKSCDFRSAELQALEGLNLNFSEILAASSQPDQSTISGIINHYAAVEDICGNQFRVKSTKGFAVGDMVMIIQMQGAKIDLTNTPNFGKVLDYGGAGKYEFNIISSINKDEVSFQRKLLNEYDTQGKVQMVSFPNIGDAAICGLTCKPWNGRSGGVLVFKGGHLKLYGSIDVSGKGFRGGKNAIENNITPCDATAHQYLYPDLAKGIAAYKGEGIAEVYADIARGRGNLSTGGGGGNNHNGGGGGGANAGAGGFGGIWQYCRLDQETRGFGGRAIDYHQIGKRLFLGGGGGAGHNNNGFGTGGGAGGGITFIVAESIKNINYAGILANGESLVTDTIYTAALDAGGGGGGGGTVVLLLEQNNKARLPIQIRGGNGTSVINTHGHGGGGGGGLLIVSSKIDPTSLDIDARGGKSGIGDDGKTNFATGGEPGGSRSISEFPMGKEMWQPLLLDTVLVEPTCKGSVLATVIAQSSADTLQFSVDGGKNWQKAPDFELSTSALYQVQVSDGCFTLDKPIQVNVPGPLQSIKTVTHQTCSTSGAVNLQGLGGFPPYNFRIVDQPWQDSGTFKALKSGIYTFQVRDQTKCLLEEVIEVEDQSYVLTLSPSPSVLIEKGNSAEIGVTISGTFKPPLKYWWYPDSSLLCNQCKSLIVKPEVSTRYEVIVRDANGCRDTVYVEVNVRDVRLYFPNAINHFSANGPNKTFFPFGDASKIKWVDLKIFNRWGDMVYSHQGKELVNDASLGWDGTSKGRPLPLGEYVYACVVEFYDGTMYTYKGGVMLLR